MYKDILMLAGLTEDQATIYEMLLKNGASPASFLIQKTGIKKGQAYKVLRDLIKLMLVEEDHQPEQVALFKPTHPQNIHAIADENMNQAIKTERIIDSLLPAMTTDFNLVSSRPGILYLEGEAGLEKIATDSLNAKSEIFEFVDAEIFAKMKHDVSKRYEDARINLKKKKRILVTGAEDIQTYRNHLNKFTEIKYLAYNLLDFKSIMMIYDDTIAYLTFDGEKSAGLLIKNPQIANLQKQFFNYGWINGKQVI